jgi:hypothetical protein
MENSVLKDVCLWQAREENLLMARRRSKALDPIGKLGSHRVVIAAALISSSSLCHNYRRGRRSLWGDIDAGLRSREIQPREARLASEVCGSAETPRRREIAPPHPHTCAQTFFRQP